MKNQAQLITYVDRLSGGGLRDLARLLDGPLGDAFGARPDGLNLAKVKDAPHGIDMGALEPRLPEVLRTPSGKIEMAPEPVLADVERLRRSLSPAPANGMRLVGRRHLRSNNSWMHNLPLLAGGRAREFMDAPLLAPTPAEFWRRYNQPAQQFFYEDVFKRVGGFRSPVRATLVTFAASALVHEYVFGVLLGRVQGYQTLFFLVQGLVVAATIRLRPKGWRMWLGIGATWIFNLATSLLFFASVNEVFPFYSRGLPKWFAEW